MKALSLTITFEFLFMRANQELNEKIVLGDHHDVYRDNNMKAQSLTITFEFLLMKAIQELNNEIKILKDRINILDSK